MAAAVISDECVNGLYVTPTELNVAPIISHLDVLVCMSSFADALRKPSHVTVEEHAWIEWAPVAVALLQAFTSTVMWCGDFFSYAWKGWKFSHDLVVTGGPSCCPVSIAGKRLRHHDPRSGQGMETARLAVELGALVLIIENVINFVEEDHLHHLVSDMDSFMEGQGMVSVGTWKLLDSDLGGASCRERAFLRWEAEDMASCLPPLGEEPLSRHQSTIVNHLDSWESVQELEVGGQSVFEEEEQTKKYGRVFRVGSVWIRGPPDAW